MQIWDREAEGLGRLLALPVVVALLITFVVIAGPSLDPKPDPGLTAVKEPTPSYTTYQSPVTPTIPALVAAGQQPPLEELEDWTTNTTAVPQSTTTEADAAAQGSGQPSTTANTNPGGGQTTTTSATTSTTAPAPDPSGFRSDYENDFFGRINSLRSSNGAPALSRDGSLDSRARDWAKKMAESGSLQHSNLGSLVPPWQAAGENLGTGPSVSSIFDALAASGSHSSTMLGDYTHVGVGVWVDSSGTLWTVHVFARQ